MSPLEISSRVVDFLNKRLIGRLATVSSSGQPHVVPVWFLWENNSIWISSYRSTRKVIDLEHNHKCALVVDVENESNGLTAVMLEGISEIVIKPPDEVKIIVERIYKKYLGAEGILEPDPQTWLNSPENVLLNVLPTRIKTW